MAMNSTIPKLSLPTDADYRNRIDRARAAMKRDGIDVLVAVSADALRFFSGLHGLPVTRPIWLVIPLEGEIGFISPGSEFKEIKARCNTPVAVRWVEWQEEVPRPMSHQDALAQQIQKVAPDARTIGIDFNGTNGAIIEIVKQKLGAERVKDVTYLIQELYAIKDQAAINLIRLSGDVAGHMVKASQATIAPGRCRVGSGAGFVCCRNQAAGGAVGRERGDVSPGPRACI